MSGLPVALSLSVSFMSAITVLGTPAEAYRYGTMFWWFAVSYTIVALVTANVFVPVFYNLGISSTYEVRRKEHMPRKIFISDCGLLVSNVWRWCMKTKYCRNPTCSIGVWFRVITRHTIFSWLKTGTLQNNDLTRQLWFISYLEYVAILTKYCNSFTWSDLNSESFTFTQSRRHGDFGGLRPPNKAPSPPKLKYETQQISGIFVKF